MFDYGSLDVQKHTLYNNVNAHFDQYKISRVRHSRDTFTIEGENT